MPYEEYDLWGQILCEPTWDPVKGMTYPGVCPFGGMTEEGGNHMSVFPVCL